MIVAVAYDNGQIGEHFGHAEMFALYDYKEADVSSCTKRLIDCSDRCGHMAMAELMRDNGVDAVLSQNMGAEAKRRLLSLGIVPVSGFCGDADTAADLLITGQLSVAGGEGGCGGCSGCGHDEGGDCACGGSCHGGG